MQPVTLNRREGVASWILPYLHRMHFDGTVLCLSYFQRGFEFDEATAESLKDNPLVILDMEEYGWAHSFANKSLHGWGRDETDLDLYPEADEYEKLWEWIPKGNIVAYFKRELTPGLVGLHDDLALSFPLLPIDLLSVNRPNPPEPRREEFLTRRGGIFHCYGNSHPSRLSLHGALQTIRNSASNSIGIAQQVLARGFETDLLEQVHFAARYPLSTVLEAQGQFRISISLGGCGNKTFRSSESCFNVVPAINDVGMKYAVEWNDRNAVMLPTENGLIQIPRAVQILEEALADQDGLWRRMRGAYEAAKELEFSNYVEKHINRHIRNNL